jgi:hypothetical protein
MRLNESDYIQYLAAWLHDCEGATGVILVEHIVEKGH